MKRKGFVQSLELMLILMLIMGAIPAILNSVLQVPQGMVKEIQQTVQQAMPDRAKAVEDIRGTEFGSAVLP